VFAVSSPFVALNGRQTYALREEACPYIMCTFAEPIPTDHDHWDRYGEGAVTSEVLGDAKTVLS